MKKFTLSILCSLGLSNAIAQVNTIYPAPASTNGTSSNRAPNGTSAHTTMRAMYLVPAADLAGISTATALTSFGFNLATGAAGGAVGNFSVYLVNTASTTYSMGTTWSTSGMTMVYNGTYSVPSTATVVDLPLSSPFAYTGGGLYVAYEYQGTSFATSPAVYNCVAVSTATQGATAASSTTTAPTTLGNTTFRPQYRFGVANPNSNDVSVDYILPTGYIPANTFTSHAIQAQIRNASNTTLTGIAVGYSVSGVTNATSTAIIPSLAPGATTIVTFPSYTLSPVSNGLNNFVVAVAPDQVNTNNIATASASIQCSILGAGPTVTDFTNTAIGFGTGSGVIYSKFMVPVTSTLVAGRMAISSSTANAGNSTWAVLADANGMQIATSNTVSLTSGMSGSYFNYTFTPQTLNPNVNYFIGLAQTANTTTAYYPLASYTTSTLPPNVYYTGALTGTAVTSLGSNFGFLGVQALLAGACSAVGIQETTIPNSSLQLYPNPAINGKTSISGLEGTNTIVVYNMLGQAIFTQITDRENVTIDLSSQMPGNYLLRVTNSGNHTKTMKVINQ